MLTLLLTSAVAFIITFSTIPAIIKIADVKKLYDVPDARKIHKKPIASLGGVGVFAGFFIAFLVFLPEQHGQFQYYFAAAVIIFFLGLKDDILVITASKKFIGQLIAAAVIIHLGGLRIDSMHGVFGITDVPYAVSLLLSYVTIILVINAYNLIDGVDGLAGVLGLLTMTAFGGYFYMAGMPAFSLLAFSMAGSLLAFLAFNNHPARIFMGDSGSLMIGLISSILVLKFISVANTASVPFRIETVVPLGIAVLAVPLLDTLRVFSVRIFSGRSPFSPDRNHIHHLLLDRGLGHRHVVLCCFLLNVMLIALAYFGRGLGTSIMLLLLVTVAMAFLGTVMYFPKRPNKTTVAIMDELAIPTHTALMSPEPMAAIGQSA